MSVQKTGQQWREMIQQAADNADEMRALSAGKVHMCEDRGDERSARVYRAEYEEHRAAAAIFKQLLRLDYGTATGDGAVPPYFGERHFDLKPKAA